MNGRCIVCGEKLYAEPSYTCHNMPQRVQNLPTAQELSTDRGVDLSLFQCSGCGLLQLDCAPLEYYKDSMRAGERSEGLTKLRQRQYKHFIETYNLQGKKIIEIGAGKGGFLRTLKDMKEYGIAEFGLENNEEYVRIAREQEQVNVIKGFCDSEDYIIEGGPFDAFTCFSYPARLVDPNTMLRAVSNNLKSGGFGYISCISQEHILKNDGVYEITRDLYAYYSVETIRFLARRNGFEVLEAFEEDPYVEAIVRKRSPLDLKTIWGNIDSMNKEVCDFVDHEIRDNRKIAVWCAGHYAFTVISVAGIGDKISYIVDNAPFKQGHYAPASHVPIVAPAYFKEHPVDTFLILGMLYAEEIINEIKEKCSKKAKIALMNEKGVFLAEG